MLIENRETSDMLLAKGGGARVLIIEAPYYREITNELAAGAIEVLTEADVGYDRLVVPGALELPQAFKQAIKAGLFGDREGRGGREARYQGALVLGCVIRGETSHYDIVCNNANHWLMESAIRYSIPLGNALLTVDTEEQAFARAKGGRAGKGGDAARACLRLIRIGCEFENQKA